MSRTAVIEWSIGALALAGFVQGALGFGFGMVAMALLPFSLSVKEASPLVVLFTLPLVLIAFYIHRRHFQWRDGWVLVLGTCVGVPLGVRLLSVVSSTALLRLLGAVLLTFALYELVSQHKPHLKIALPSWSAVPIGVISGITSGAFNAGGPPLVAYAYTQSWSKERVIALLQVLFAIGAALRMVTMLHEGLITSHTVSLGMWATLPVLVALLAGTRLLRHVPMEKLRRGVFLFLAVIALKYLLWA
jgi:uncharacterized membrane protein YfcA